MRYPLAVQLLALILFALLPRVAEGQQSLVRGTWTLNRDQSDDVGARINATLGRLNYVTRQLARPRMRRTNIVFPRLVIAYDDQTVRLEMEGSPTLSSPANGQPVLWQRLTGASCPEVRGECVRVMMEWESGTLQQTLIAENGRRVNVLSVSADGNTLTMNVTLTSTHLPVPLTYRLVYDRAA